MGLCAGAKDWPFIQLHQPEFESVQPGAHSEVRMTAILTWNGAFVSQTVLWSWSQSLTFFPALPQESFFFCQTGVEQNSVRAIEFSHRLS